MNYREFKRDIFEHLDALKDSPDRVILLHTISGDCRMGAGIAKAIEDRLHWRSAVLCEDADGRGYFNAIGPWVWSKQHDGWENAIGHEVMKLSYPVSHIIRADAYYRDILGDPYASQFDILGLVTKERYWQKPTIQDMSAALESLAGYLESLCDLNDSSDRITLVMPTIGCGLDRLDWPEVSYLIHARLGGIPNLTVEVCQL